MGGVPFIFDMCGKLVSESDQMCMCTLLKDVSADSHLVFRLKRS